MQTKLTLRLDALHPLDTRPLFAPLHLELIELLRGLGGADWTRPTVAGSWRVRDVVAHLLDVQARDVSMLRDGHCRMARSTTTRAWCAFSIG